MDAYTIDLVASRLRNQTSSSVNCQAILARQARETGAWLVCSNDIIAQRRKEEYGVPSVSVHRLEFTKGNVVLDFDLWLEMVHGAVFRAQRSEINEDVLKIRVGLLEKELMGAGRLIATQAAQLTKYARGSLLSRCWRFVCHYWQILISRF